MPQQKQLYFRVVDRQPYIKQIEKQPKPGDPKGQATLLGVACPPMNM